MTIFSNALKDVDTKHAGSASGTMNALEQLGGAIGIAFIGVIFFGQISHNAAVSFDDTAAASIKTAVTKAGIPDEVATQIVDASKTCYIDRNNQKDFAETPESCTKLEQNSGSDKNPVMAEIGKTIEKSVLDANAKNFTTAYHAALIYAWILAGITLILSFMFPRKMTYDPAGH